MNSKERKKLARAVAHRAAKAQAAKFESNIVTGLMGCSLNVSRATSSPSLREKHESSSVCLADVALYQAGHRKVRKDAVHITK
ncbi:MAG TPA: hypothetical protein DEO73_17465 [Pantoea sp.]|nr:hypothetical protein [Pantoea sp.]